MLIITIFFKRGLSKGEYKFRKYPKMAKYIENKVKIDKWAPGECKKLCVKLPIHGNKDIWDWLYWSCNINVDT